MQHDHEHHHGTITVIGEGVAKARPDAARVTLGVVTQGKRPADAAAENAAIAARVIAAVRAQGIDEDAIRSAGLGVDPVYEWDDANKQNRLVGYRASNSISVTSPIDAVAAVYDAGIEAGATEASGVAFGVLDDRPLRTQALKQATLRGIEEAHLVARTLGVVVRGPVEVELLGGSGPQPSDNLTLRKAAETPVMPGELQVSERVRLVFQTRLTGG